MKNMYDDKNNYFYLSKNNVNFEEIKDSITFINKIVDSCGIKLQTSDSIKQMTDFFSSCNLLKVLKREFKEKKYSEEEYISERDRFINELWMKFSTSKFKQENFKKLVFKWVDIFSQVDGYSFVKSTRTKEEILDSILEIEDLFNNGIIIRNSETSLYKFYNQFVKYIEVSKLNLIQLQCELNNCVNVLLGLEEKREEDGGVDLFLRNLELRSRLISYSPYSVIKHFNLENEYYDKRQVDIGTVSKNMRYFTYINTNFRKLENPDSSFSYMEYKKKLEEDRKFKEYLSVYDIVDGFYCSFVHSLIIALELFLKYIYIELAQSIGENNQKILQDVSKTFSHNYKELLKQIYLFNDSNINNKLEEIKDIVTILNDRKSLENIRYDLGYLNDLDSSEYFELFLFLYNEYLEIEYKKRQKDLT